MGGLKEPWLLNATWLNQVPACCGLVVSLSRNGSANAMRRSSPSHLIGLVLRLLGFGIENFLLFGIILITIASSVVVVIVDE